jgi:hypothetical protein
MLLVWFIFEQSQFPISSHWTQAIFSLIIIYIFKKCLQTWERKWIIQIHMPIPNNKGSWIWSINNQFKFQYKTIALIIWVKNFTCRNVISLGSYPKLLNNNLTSKNNDYNWSKVINDKHIKCSWELCMDMSWFVVFAMLSHGFCHNPNIGFATKYGVQGPMRPRECV